MMDCIVVFIAIILVMETTKPRKYKLNTFFVTWEFRNDRILFQFITDNDGSMFG